MMDQIMNDTSLDLFGGYSTSTMSPEPQQDEYLISLKHKLYLTRLLVQKVLLPTIVLIGVVGNFLNIAVLTRRWMRSSTNFYLTALAIYDILYLIFALTMSFKHYDIVSNQEWYIRYRKPIGKPFVDTASNTGIWLTLTFTIERYIGVCHPMKGKRWCTPERARIIIFIVCFIAAIITFPEFFEHVVSKDTLPDNTTALSAKQTAFSLTVSYQWGYVYTNQTLFTFLPLLLLLVFNSLLIKAVTAATKTRKAMVNQQVSTKQRQQAEQQRITVMLISVVIVFLICQLPQAILNLYNTYLDATGGFTNERLYIILIANNVCNLLVMLNSSINFVLYSSFSTKFRRTFKKLFCKCLYGPSHELNVLSDCNSADNSTHVVKLRGSTGPKVATAITLKNGNHTTRLKNGYMEVNQEIGDSISSV